MKFDMGGAASVLGTLRAIAELKPQINVVGIIPACENMPGGDAVKPGDVVTSLSGQTIEILNTDAEGRLILCDALTYAERFKPAVVVDIATLTGACVIALGHHRSGLFSSRRRARRRAAAGRRRSGARPMLAHAARRGIRRGAEEQLRRHGQRRRPRAGGAITAAMFLQRFTGKYPWAHLDIAGTAWKGGAAKGATGRPVRPADPLRAGARGLTRDRCRPACPQHDRGRASTPACPTALHYACRLLRKAYAAQARGSR